MVILDAAYIASLDPKVGIPPEKRSPILCHHHILVADLLGFGVARADPDAALKRCGLIDRASGRQSWKKVAGLWL